MVREFIRSLNEKIVCQMGKWGMPFLRISIGIVFLWFGILKIINQSPLAPLIENSYSFFPFPAFLIFLGIWEVVIGLGLIFQVCLRLTLFLLWLQVGGIIGSIFLSPTFFYEGNPFFLTLEGEFVLKNLIIVAASLVIGGYKIPKNI